MRRRLTGGGDLEREDPMGAGGGVRLPSWIRSLPVLLLLVVLALQPVTTGGAQVDKLLSVVPPFAGLVYGVRLTALVTAGVVGLLALPLTRAPYIGQGDLVVVTVLGLFSILLSWGRTRALQDVVIFRSASEAAQRAVLPPLPERVWRVRCAGLYRPAVRSALVGGDFYDLRDGPHGPRALVGDVKGHGLPAVGTVAALLGAFREGVLDDATLDRVAERMDRRLAVDAGGDPSAELFATALLLEFSAAAEGPGAVVRLVSRGHPPALLLRDGQVRQLAAAAGPPLGLASVAGGAAGAGPEPLVVELLPGDVLLCYTDGVTEARDAKGRFYPLAERLAARGHGERRVNPVNQVNQVNQVNLVNLVKFVWRDVSDFAADIDDDVALLALAVEPEGADGPGEGAKVPSAGPGAASSGGAGQEA